MKIRPAVFLLLFSTGQLLADASNQCLVDQRAAKNPSEEILDRLDECMKDKSCAQEDRQYVCPWAESRSELPSLSDDEKKKVDELCEQCEQMEVIACSYSLNSANESFNKAIKVFVDDNDAAKPLIFGYAKPNPVANNLNLAANLRKLMDDNEVFKTELKTLTDKLTALTQNITSETILRANLKKSQQATQDFAQKWAGLYKDSAQLYYLTSELLDFMAEWQDRMLATQHDSGCSAISGEVDKASAAGEAFVSQLESITTALENLSFSKRLELAGNFSENAIKLSYLAASRKTVEELHASIGAVLDLDRKVMESNLWWIEVSRGGLASGLHTSYYQYRKPLEILVTAVGEGQKFIDQVRAIKGLSASAMTAAVNGLQGRQNLLQSDITWLKTRGWKGQYKSQVETVDSWLKSLPRKDSTCGKLLAAYQNQTKSFLGEDFEVFEAEIEPKFIQAIQACEAE
jgi:hypothetical protein